MLHNATMLHWACMPFLQLPLSQAATKAISTNHSTAPRHAGMGWYTNQIKSNQYLSQGFHVFSVASGMHSNKLLSKARTRKAWPKNSRVNTSILSYLASSSAGKACPLHSYSCFLLDLSGEALCHGTACCHWTSCLSEQTTQRKFHTSEVLDKCGASEAREARGAEGERTETEAGEPGEGTGTAKAGNTTRTSTAARCESQKSEASTNEWTRSCL